MVSKTQLRKYASEWISKQVADSIFHVREIYNLTDNFPDECDAAGRVPSGEAHYTNDARQAIRDCRPAGLISKVSQRRDGYWQRTKKTS